MGIAEFQRFSAPDPTVLEREIEASRQRLAAAVDTNDTAQAVEHAADLAGMLTTARREAEALQVLQPHDAAADTLTHLEASGWFRNAHATALQYLGRRDDAGPVFAKALTISRAGGWQRLESFVLQYWGRSLVEQGRLDEAQARFTEALHLRRQLNDPRQASTQRALEGLAQWRGRAALDAPPIAIGRTARIHAWPNDSVLKVFHDWVDDAAIDSEARATRIAHELGLGAPRVGELVDIGDARGLVFERLGGRSMLEMLVHSPADGTRLAIRLAELHARLHGVTAPPELPAQADRLRHAIAKADLPPSLRPHIERRLAGLPAESLVCHGDFHPGNVMLDGTKHAVIDWNDATRGSPAVDVARTTVLLLGAAFEEPAQMPDQANVVRAFHEVYLQRYFELAPDRRSAYEQALPVLAAARLSEGRQAGREWLLQVADRCTPV